MHESDCTYEYFLQHIEEIISSKQFVIIDKMLPQNSFAVRYRIVNNEEEFLNYLKWYNNKINEAYINRDIFFSVRDEGAIVTFPLSDFIPAWMQSIKNLIFLKEITLNNPNAYDEKTKEPVGVEISNCYFLEKLNMNSFEWSSLSMSCCHFYKEVNMQNMRINKSLEMHSCEFSSGVVMQGTHSAKFGFNNIVLKDLNLDNFIINGITELLNIKINGKTTMKNSLFKGRFALDCSLETINAYLDFNDAILDSKATLKFSKMLGTLNFNDLTANSIIKVLFSDHMQGEFSSLLIKDYEGKINFKNTKENYFKLSGFLSSDKDRTLYLKAIYLFKYYETREVHSGLREKAGLQKFKLTCKYLVKLLIEKTTKYFTSYTTCLRTIVLVNILFTFFYFVFANNIYLGTEPLSSNNLIRTVSNIDWKAFISDIQYFKHLISRGFYILGKSLYFSLITFTTIGYGDISPKNCCSLIAAFEGLTGVIMVSIFTICLSREYMN